MSWLKRKHSGIKRQAKSDVAAGVFTKCEGCREILIHKELERNQWTCPKCGYHFRVRSDVYVSYLIDEGTFEETFNDLSSQDPLEFRDARMRYPDRIAQAQKATGMKDAVLTGRGLLAGKPVAIAAMDFFFMGGSMGSVVGEKVARTFDLARQERRAVITVTASGGARMQEGILSLMQLAKTSVAAAELREARLPFISILTDPSTAGVMASFASLGDVILAEPAALIGFAGPRVIQDTIREELPEGFQRSDFVLEHGFVDRVVSRREMRDAIASLLEVFHHGTRGFTLGSKPPATDGDPSVQDNPRVSIARPAER
ncbi:MAG TPA: acetyl-CoA carboxylase, carboxyltransferase subunit beta [Candidatus Eisenbacteria bacterium]|jgi:acetyl-CoA carboxylase carboxyl transferase subunit beta|nr:acetyl-CoA carboxylase, carboxyltransferase subunit beta [Candidatus Eisenbacteria bacterium]